MAYCMYDGGHGDWPDEPRAANLVWDFFINATQHLDHRHRRLSFSASERAEQTMFA